MRTTPVISVLIAAIVASLWWFARGNTDDASHDLGSALESAPDSRDPSRTLAEPAGLGSSLGGSRTIAGSVESAIVAVSRKDRFTLSGAFVLAPGHDILVDPPKVRLFDELGIARAAQLDSTREFAFRVLAAGRYWLEVRSREDGNARAVVDLIEDTRIELALTIPPVVLVRVEGWSPTEAMLRHLRAVATQELPHQHIARGDRTGAVGRFETLQPDEKVARPDVLGLLVLDADGPFHASLTCDEFVIDTQFVSSGQREVVFDVPPDDRRLATGAVRFRLVDAQTGSPIERFSAWFDGINHGMFTCQGGIGAKDGLAPGLWHMSVQAPGHAQRVLDVTVAPGRTTDLGDLLSAPGVSVSGKVVFDGVGVVTGVRCEPCDEHGELDPPFPEIHELRADGGVFAFKAMHPSRYRLQFRVTDPSGIAETVRILDARRGSVEDLRVELARGVPIVVTPSERWRRGWRFRVLDARGVRITTRDLDGPRPASVLVAPGSYVVELVRGTNGGPSDRVAVEVASTPVRVAMQ